MSKKQRNKAPVKKSPVSKAQRVRAVAKRATVKKPTRPRVSAAQKAPRARKTSPSPAQPADNVAAPRPIVRDPRLPPVGTVLRKLDRNGVVRCECIVEADGYRYKDKLYRSPTASGMAAAGDLGLENRTLNGYVFWNIAKPVSVAKDPITALKRQWDRYHRTAATVVRGVTDENRAELLTALKDHERTIEKLYEQAA